MCHPSWMDTVGFLIQQYIIHLFSIKVNTKKATKKRLFRASFFNYFFLVTLESHAQGFFFAITKDEQFDGISDRGTSNELR